jgi:hypothetical protein
VVERSPVPPGFCRELTSTPAPSTAGTARPGQPADDEGWQVPQAAFSGLLTLAAGRPLLLDLSVEAVIDVRAATDHAVREAAAAWTDRVTLVHATCPGHPDLRGILVRPDGHTAWLRTDVHDHPDVHRHPDADQHTDGLRQALTDWHGPSV